MIQYLLSLLSVRSAEGHFSKAEEKSLHGDRKSIVDSASTTQAVSRMQQIFPDIGYIKKKKFFQTLLCLLCPV